MSEQIALDLGQYGIILVEAEKVDIGSDVELVQTGRLDEAGEFITVKAQAMLQRPLTGLANTILASLPEEQIEGKYALDEVTVEFQLGFGVEAGTDAGIVAKITPNGTLKCKYTWRNRAEKMAAAEQEVTPVETTSD